MRTEIKTKYTTVSFNEDHNGSEPFYWVSIGLAYAKGDSGPAKVFAILMDARLLGLARLQLKDAVENSMRDVYLEDVDVMVTLKADQKHLAASIIGMVEAVEAEFDARVAVGKEIK